MFLLKIQDFSGILNVKEKKRMILSTKVWEQYFMFFHFISELGRLQTIVKFARRFWWGMESVLFGSMAWKGR